MKKKLLAILLGTTLSFNSLISFSVGAETTTKPEEKTEDSKNKKETNVKDLKSEFEKDFKLNEAKKPIVVEYFGVVDSEMEKYTEGYEFLKDEKYIIEYEFNEGTNNSVLNKIEYTGSTKKLEFSMILPSVELIGTDTYKTFFDASLEPIDKYLELDHEKIMEKIYEGFESQKKLVNKKTDDSLKNKNNDRIQIIHYIFSEAPTTVVNYGEIKEFDYKSLIENYKINFESPSSLRYSKSFKNNDSFIYCDSFVGKSEGEYNIFLTVGVEDGKDIEKPLMEIYKKLPKEFEGKEDLIKEAIKAANIDTNEYKNTEISAEPNISVQISRGHLTGKLERKITFGYKIDN